MASKKKSAKSAAKSDRNYLLTSEQLETLRQDWKADGAKKSCPPNPYRTGSYRAIVAALIELGVNKGHPFSSLKKEIKRSMSLAETRTGEGDAAQTAWERFAGRDARNDETGKDVDGRLFQNIQVLQRHDYGAKLIQVGKEILRTKGMAIDILPGNAIRLSTDSNTPERQLRRAPKETAPAKANKAAKPTTKKTANGAKPKAKPRKGAVKEKSDITPQPFPEVSELGQATLQASR